MQTNKSLIIFALLFSTISLQVSAQPHFLQDNQEENKNNNLLKPIIGIVTSPHPFNDDSGHETQITWSYVRWLEDAGGKVLPLHFDYSNEEVLELMPKINGVLWQGGNRDLSPDGVYEKNSRFILEEALKRKIPIWLTCEGFELLHVIIANDAEVLSNFDASEYETSNELNKEVSEDPQMFKFFSKEDFQNYEDPKIPSTMHLHRLGVSPDAYQKYPALDEMLRITSFGYDREGKKFISTVEGKDPSMRIYSTQFHPEQVPYGYNRAKLDVMNVNALRISQKLPLQFIEDAISTLKDNNMTEEEEVKYGVFSSYTKIPNRITQNYDISYLLKDRKF